MVYLGLWQPCGWHELVFGLLLLMRIRVLPKLDMPMASRVEPSRFWTALGWGRKSGMSPIIPLIFAYG